MVNADISNKYIYHLLLTTKIYHLENSRLVQGELTAYRYDKSFRSLILVQIKISHNNSKPISIKTYLPFKVKIPIASLKMKQ